MEDDRKVFLLRVRRPFPAGLWEEKKKMLTEVLFYLKKNNS